MISICTISACFQISEHYFQLWSPIEILIRFSEVIFFKFCFIEKVYQIGKAIIERLNSGTKVKTMKLFLQSYSQTWTNDHLRITITWLQRPQFLGTIFTLFSIKLPLNNDHLSTTTTNSGSREWSLYTGLTVYEHLWNNIPDMAKLRTQG